MRTSGGGVATEAVTGSTTRPTTGTAPPRAGRPRRREPVLDWAVISALLFAAFLLAALPLLVLGWFRPLPTLALSAVAAVALLRWLPSGLPRRPAAPRWTTLATAVVAAGFALVQALLHAEHVVLRRDPGSYAQIAYWLHAHGSEPIPAALAAFGGHDTGLTPGSPAFYDIGNAVQPQFMAGTPLVLAAAGWLGGMTGILVANAFIGALALVAAGGLTRRLVGSRWAPLVVLALAVTTPIWHTSRATYSEPLDMLLLLTGLCLLVDALDGAPARVAAVAGLLMGLGVLVRVDALREVMLLVPVAGWLWLRERSSGAALWRGLALGTAYGALDAGLLAYRYIGDITASVLPLAVLLVLTVAVTVVVTRRLARRGSPLGLVERFPIAPNAGAAAVVLAALVLLSRPLWLKAHDFDGTSVGRSVGSMQLRFGLPFEPGRSYAEQSATWLSWWLGWPTLVLALVAAAVLARRVFAGHAARWVGPLAVILGTTVLTMWRPGITPDHPWADRRFVPVVLPGLVLLAVWAVAAGGRSLRSRWPARPRLLRAWVAAGSAVVLVPAAVLSWPLVTQRTEVGEVAAVAKACAALRPGDAVLALDSRAALEWLPALREQCGVPAVSVRLALSTNVAAYVARARAAGSTPVLVSGVSPQPILAAGVRAHHVVALLSQEDARELVRRPRDSAPLTVNLWMGRPKS